MKTDSIKDIKELFNISAKRPTKKLDQKILNGTYERGNIFLKCVKKYRKKNDKILDYGCGRGRISKILSENGFRVVGVDLSKKSIEAAKNQRIDGLEIEFIESEKFNKRAKYDGIVCSSVIEFVEDYQKLLKNFYEMLNDDGSIFISVANKNSIWRKYSYFRYKHEKPHFNFQKSTWKPADFIVELKNSGFKKIKIEKYFGPEFSRYRIFNKITNIKYIGTLCLIKASKK